jgi:hypothetical protein
MAKAFELFFNDASAYPTGTAYTALNGAMLGTSAAGGVLTAQNPSGTVYNLTPTYLTGVPAAPTPADSATCTGNNNYIYQTNTAGSTYTLTFCTGGSVGGSSGILGTPGVHYLTPGGFK